MAFLQKRKQKRIQSRFLLVVVVVVAAFLSAFLGQIVISNLLDAPSLISDNSFIVQQTKDPRKELKETAESIFSREIPGMVELYEQQGSQMNKLGNGIVLTNDGWVLGVNDTATHIRLDSGELIATKEAISDPASPMVFLQIDSVNLAPVTLADHFFAEPLGSYLLVSYRGLIQETQYIINDLIDDELLSSDKVNRHKLFTKGELGEVVYNNDSEVIGIVIGKNEAGFAEVLDVAEVRKVLDDVLRNQIIERTILGLSYIDLSKTPLSKELASGVANGALIRSIVIDPSLPIINAENPAILAGLRVNDIIVSIDSDIINDHISLSEYVVQKKPGDTVELGILRRGQPLSLEATVISSSPKAEE